MNAADRQSLKRLNVLTLDGGGIRGISSILILQDLMVEINTSIREQNAASNIQPAGPHQDVEPHEIFDLVAGTSTGGLIAIMLGKLGMSLEECVEAYDNLSRTIFCAKHRRARLTLGLAPARYSGKTMQNCVQELLQSRGFDSGLQIAYTNQDRIACSVVCREHQTESRYSDYKTNPVCICSLQCPDPVLCRVYEAARATSAAPTYFPIQEMNGRSFADGGIEFNNPSWAIYYHYSEIIRVSESRRTSIASNTESIGGALGASHGNLDFSYIRIINLGTGTEPNVSQAPESGVFEKFTPPPIKMAAFLARTLKKTATTSERVASHMRSLALVSGGNGPSRIKYERFSENNGVCYIKLDKYKKLEEIKAKTRAYLAAVKTRKELRRVARDIARDYLDAQRPPPRATTLAVPGNAPRGPPFISLSQSSKGPHNGESYSATVTLSSRVSGEMSGADSTISEPSNDHDNLPRSMTPIVATRTSVDITGPAESMVRPMEPQLMARA